MYNTHRTLLPQPENYRDRQPVDPEPLDPRRKRRRKNIRIACNACRTKKCACDGNRPICSQCVERDTECKYITENSNDTPNQALKRKVEYLQQELGEQTEILNDLKFMPEKQAIQLFRTLRSGSSPTSSGPSSSSMARKRSETSNDERDTSSLEPLDLEDDISPHSRRAITDPMVFEDGFDGIDPLLTTSMDSFPLPTDGIPAFSHPDFPYHSSLPTSPGHTGNYDSVYRGSWPQQHPFHQPYRSSMYPPYNLPTNNHEITNTVLPYDL